MSLREVIRSKLKSLDRDKEVKEPVNEPAIQNGSPQPRTSVASSSSPPTPLSRTASATSLDNHQVFREGDDKSFNDLQLVQLQEQLVASMIENQALASELKRFKEKNGIEKLEILLDFEKQRSLKLSQELDEAKKVEVSRSKQVDVTKQEHVTKIVTESEDIAFDTEMLLKPSSKSVSTLVRDWLMSALYELIADFSEDPIPETSDVDPEGEQLSVKSLKENIKRFKQGMEPIYETFKGIKTLLTWKNPTFTLIAFVLYNYAVWNSFLLPFLLFLLLLRLAANYLLHKGFDFKINFLPVDAQEPTDSQGEEFSELGVSDKFNLVVQVARQVQNTLGFMADTLEKIKNLLLWKQQEATLQLFLFLVVCFVLSWVLPGNTLALISGLFLGLKLFVIEFIYSRFPRFKQRHDSVDQMWKSLPTDKALEEQHQTAAIDKHLLPSLSDQTNYIKQLSEDDQLFCNIFSLPSSENPKPGWGGGRRCTLIDKEKSWTSAFVNGRLYLTRSFLCFERVQEQSSKNILIPLKDITNIHKAKPYAWMPGAGMSVEVCVTGYDKPHLFGALLNRDEIYDNIITHAVNASLPWASSAVGNKTASPSGKTVSEVRSGDTSSLCKVSVRLSELTELEGDEYDVLNISTESQEVTC